MTNTQPELTDVLHQFSLEADGFSLELLRQYCREYPQFALQLRHFAVYMAADKRLPEEVETSEQETADFVTKAMSQFQNAMYASNQTVTPVEIARRFKSLKTDPPLDLSLRVKFGARIVRAESVSPRFLQFLANALEVTREALAAFLSGPPNASLAVDFKAEKRPGAGRQEDLNDSIAASSLSEQQKHALLSLNQA